MTTEPHTEQWWDSPLIAGLKFGVICEHDDFVLCKCRYDKLVAPLVDRIGRLEGALNQDSLGDGK